MTDAAVKRVGVSGTGMISHCFVRLIMQHYKDMKISRVLTRRRIDSMVDFPIRDALTNSIDELIEHSDIIVECTGDVFFGTEVIERAFEAGIPVVTINAELQVTTGSYLSGKGLLTEAEGDQPGSLAALREDALQMGFQPLVYGNMKGYLNHNPSREDMAYWSNRQGTSIEQTTSFTDGTKVQIEQVVVGNGFGATISRRGLEGVASTDLNTSGNALALIAEGIGQPIVDYVLPSGYSAGGVFLVCSHDQEQAPAIEYFKMGAGPYYVLTRPFHLCSLEVGKTVRRVLAGGGVLLNNSVAPTLGVAAIAKHDMKAGDMISRGIGGFDVRGEAVKLVDELNHVPIGLLRNTVLKRAVEPGQLITFDDIEVQPSRVVDIIIQQQQKVALQCEEHASRIQSRLNAPTETLLQAQL